MAVHAYGCSACGIQEEKLYRKDPPQSIPCPNCGAEAKKMISDFGFVFADGKVPGNTGVDSLDRDHDKRIGRDAQSRWEYIKDRNSRKRQIQKDHGGVGKVPLRLNKEGDYEPMPKEDVQRFRRLHQQNAEALAQKESTED